MSDLGKNLRCRSLRAGFCTHDSGRESVLVIAFVTDEHTVLLPDIEHCHEDCQGFDPEYRFCVEHGSDTNIPRRGIEMEDFLLKHRFQSNLELFMDFSLKVHF